MASSQLELISLPGRGRAECLRLMLIYAGKKFTDTRVTIQQWKNSRKLEGMDEQTKLPVLKVNGNKKIIVGAVEIGRYIAVNYGLYGVSSAEQDLINGVITQTEVLNSQLAPIIRATLTKNYDARKEHWNEYKEHTLNPTLSIWEEELSKRNNLVGTKYTWADICVIELLTRFQTCYDSFYLACWPVLKGLVDRFERLPNMKQYISNRPDTHF